MKPNPILTRIFRGHALETTHRGSWVVLEGDRELELGGEPDAWTYPRSALKPLQLLPLFASGALDPFDLGAEHLAVLCASHSGDEQHVERVREIQNRARIPESALGCGPHAPMDLEAAVRLWARGESPLRVHNNCSGKHTGFLIRARDLGAPLEGYLDPEHPVQVEVRGTLARLTGLSDADLSPGVDGCGAPNWPLPLRTLAALFRDLANPERLPEEHRAGAERMFQAINSAPHFLAGRGRFDTALLQAGNGRFLGKCGAEGVFALGIRAEGRPPIGIAIKVDDGAKRAYEVALPGLLVELGILEGTEEALATFYGGEVQNTQGLVVGRMEPRWT